MQVIEKTMPWWRRALRFALGGIRSGFGLFARPARLEPDAVPVAVPTISDSLEENVEEERALTKPFSKIEVAEEAPEVPAEPVSPLGPVAEFEPLPEPAIATGIAAGSELAAEPAPAPVDEEDALGDMVPAEAAPEVGAEKSEARTEFSEDHSAEDKQAVEKPGISGEIGGEHPSGPKGHADFAALTARLKSCPDTKRPFESASTSFSAASKALTYQSRPDTPLMIPAVGEAALADMVPAEAKPESAPEVGAEKSEAKTEFSEGSSAGDNAQVDSSASAERLKSCPDTRQVLESDSSVAHETETAREAEVEPEVAADPHPPTEPQTVAEVEPVAIPAAEGSLDAQLTPPEVEVVNVEIVNEAALEPVLEIEATQEAESEEEAGLVAEPETEKSVNVEVVAEAAPEPVAETEPIDEVVEGPDEETEPVVEIEAAQEVVPKVVEEIEPIDEVIEGLAEEAEPLVEAEFVNEPETGKSVNVEVVTEAVPEPVAEADPVEEAMPELAETAESEIEAEPETVDTPEVVDVTAAEAFEEPELETEAEPEAVTEAEASIAPVCAPDVEQPVLEVEPEAATVPEPISAPEPTVEIGPEMEPVEILASEAGAEPESKPEPVAEQAPAADDGAKLVLTAEPSAEEKADAKAEEKAAAKLAARQKKLDEGSEQSPFSVFVGQVYDGPLDLLLDLIRKQDIDIYDIPIARITAQFLAYVNQLKAGDVDVAGEFIYTASMLIHIKSKMLLPRAPSGPEDAAEDPRRELVERLLEHERFKNAAQMLQEKQMLEAATWSNPGVREFKGDEGTEPEIAADTVDLVRIFRDILERARNRPVLNVEEDSVTVGQMIQFLARRLTMEDKPVALRRLLSHTRSERALIAMFLALLEMVRMQAILLRQDLQFSEIFIKKHTGFDAVMNDGLGNARDDWR
jgi:segregation and condensation protein A